MALAFKVIKCADGDRVIFGSSEGGRIRKCPFFQRLDTWRKLSVVEVEVYSGAVGHGLGSMSKSCQRGFERIRADEHQRTAWSEGSN
jgi:hypothetical protein